MKRQLLESLVIVVGLCLVVLGSQWSRAMPSAAYWSDEKAAEFTDAQADLHSKIDQHGDGQSHERELEAAKERFLSISGELERARNSRNYTGTALEVIGVLAVIAGVATHYAGRSNS